MPINAADELPPPRTEARFGEELTATDKTFRYRAKTILAADGGLIGVWVEVANLSEKAPLQLRSHGPIPFGIVLADSNGNIIVSGAKFSTDGKPIQDRANQRATDAGLEEWELPPSGSKGYLISIKALLPTPLATERKGPLILQVRANAFPQWVRRDIWEHPYGTLDFKVFLSKAALGADPQQSLREAQSAVPPAK